MLKHREVVRWFLIINFLIGLLFAGIFVIIPDLFLNFINWSIPAADHRALFGYRILGVAIFGISIASFLASFKDEFLIRYPIFYKISINHNKIMLDIY